MAAYHIHHPILMARSDAVSAAHVHTGWGTPFAAERRPILPISQESCIFFEDHALFDDEEVQVQDTDGGRRIAEVLQTAKVVVMVTHDMSWITAFCTRAVLVDKGRIVADGNPEEIADMHEKDAAKRAKRKRKAKQLLKHGKVELVDIKKARKEGKLDELVEGHEAEMEKLRADKKRKQQENRAKRRAKRLAREAKEAEAPVTADGSGVTPPAGETADAGPPAPEAETAGTARSSSRGA